ncbi:MAG: hypothetical protein WD875_02955 [Pirellulales bacterium]
MNAWFAKLFRLRENVESIDSHAISFAEPWARLNAGFVAALAVIAIAASLAFYLRGQRRGSRGGRLLLACCRGGLLALLVVILGDPVFRIAYTYRPKPLLYLVFDGTDSMGIVDRWSDQQRSKLDDAVGRTSDATAKTTGSSGDANGGEVAAKPIGPTRLEYVQALLRNENDPLLAKLQEKFRIKCFQFSRRDEVDAITAEGDGEAIDAKKLADALSSDGQVTNLSSALASLAGKHASSRLSGVVIFSDFDKNSGGEPAGSETTPAERLGVPIYAVGIGPEHARDAKVKVFLATTVMRQGDKRSIAVSVEHEGLAGRTATVRLIAQRLAAGDEGQGDAEPIEVGSREVTLGEVDPLIESFDFVPTEPGMYDVTAEIDSLEEETATDNNRETRKLKVLDEYVRLLFVEYEPTWEWRFIKEVFHRDPLVGVKGFRTYLHSAHPSVKQSHELFASSLTPPTRSEFFANDVIFLGDIPAEVLTKGFCDRLEEFVGEFGGGLVVMAGPRFGVGQYARVTSNPDFDEALGKIRAMLPVEVDPNARIKEERFRIDITPLGRERDFMKLTGGGSGSNGGAIANGSGANEGDWDSAGWDNLGYLPWYQPVRAVRGGASVLATHPTDTCPEGDKQLQPLIATRSYGSRGGQVVYLGFNETWRMRRKFGEKYYQQFWGQLIHQLGFSHELGGDKRFVVRADNKDLRYQAGDKVTLTVEAYDEDFKPLDADRVAKLDYRITRPSRSTAGETTAELSLPSLHAGRYETQFPVFAEGTYRVQVKDPITGQWKPPLSFTVSSRSPERRNAVRNVAVQEALATRTAGRSYDLTTVASLVDDVEGLSKAERVVEVHKLWSTWPCFALVVMLMLGEWLGRKMVNLP